MFKCYDAYASCDPGAAEAFKTLVGLQDLASSTLKASTLHWQPEESIRQA